MYVQRSMTNIMTVWNSKPKHTTTGAVGRFPREQMAGSNCDKLRAPNKATVRQSCGKTKQEGSVAVLKFECALQLPGGLVETHTAGPLPLTLIL